MAKRSLLLKALPHVATRLPVLKRVPVVKLIAAAELAGVARLHLQHLDPAQRRRLVELQRRRVAELLRRGRKLSTSERDELKTLVAALEPRAFAGSAVERLSPVPLPKRLTRARY